MPEELYDKVSDSIEIRRVVVTRHRKGYRKNHTTLFTSIKDQAMAPLEELDYVYGCRWGIELNLRSLKTTMKMEHLAAKTPQMVRKEMWATMLGYNLVRILIAEAAWKSKKLVHELSFKNALQHFNVFKILWITLRKKFKPETYQTIVGLIGRVNVANRPGRIEPRAVKKRPKPFPRLQAPRAEARAQMVKQMAA